MAGQFADRWDLLLVVTNDRYGSFRFGTVWRLINAALRNGRSVRVWACGDANQLTELAPHQSDPPTEADGCSSDRSPTASSCCSSDEASTAEQIGSLVTESEGRFTWLACQTCSDERGAGEHVPDLPTPSFADLRDYVDSSAKTIFIGGV